MLNKQRKELGRAYYSHPDRKFNERYLSDEYNAYFRLYEMSLLDFAYNKINKQYLNYQGNSKEERLSATAQYHLKATSVAATSIKAYQKYHCNACENFNDKFKSYSRFHWSGKSNFEKNRTFADFINKEFEPLRKWAKNSFPKDHIDGYIVMPLSLMNNNYNFEKKAFILNFPSSTQAINFGGSTARNSKVVPDGNTFKTVAGRNYRTFMLPMEVNQAETFAGRVMEENGVNNRLHYVQKIRIYPGPNFNEDYISRNIGFVMDLRYKTISDTFEIFLGDDLQEKIGTFNITTAGINSGY